MKELRIGCMDELGLYPRKSFPIIRWAYFLAITALAILLVVKWLKA